MRPSLGTDDSSASTTWDTGGIRKDAVHHAPIHDNVPCQAVEGVNHNEDDQDFIHLGSLHRVVESLLIRRHTEREQTRGILESIQQMLISLGIILTLSNLMHNETLARTADIRPTCGHGWNDNCMDTGRHWIGIMRCQV